MVIWLTGLPASGKTTLAQALRAALLRRDVHSCVIDGDDLRAGVCQDLGFSRDDRLENVRRASELARLLSRQGVVVIVALITPCRPGSGFFLVHVDCPIRVCRERDPKGMYLRADRGEIKQFTGVSAPYELPHNPDAYVQTDEESVKQAVSRLVQAVLG